MTKKHLLGGSISRYGTAVALKKQYKGESGFDVRAKDLENVDDVIDLFEDLGFYIVGYQVSPEVVHHHFYHWTRGYLEAAREYVVHKQIKEKGRWEHFDKVKKGSETRIFGRLSQITTE